MLGELIFACVVCRLDIAYSLSLLSCYAEYPLALHYDALRGVCKYLRETKSKPITFWRKEPLESLPPTDFIPYELPEGMDFLFPEDPYLINAEVDASHATDEDTRRSTGGHVLYLFANNFRETENYPLETLLNNTNIKPNQPKNTHQI